VDGSRQASLALDATDRLVQRNITKDGLAAGMSHQRCLQMSLNLSASQLSGCSVGNSFQFNSMSEQVPHELCSQDRQLEQELVSKTRHLCMDMTQDQGQSSSTVIRDASMLPPAPVDESSAHKDQSARYESDVSMMTIDQELSAIEPALQADQLKSVIETDFFLSKRSELI
jgi:hypothetical protein